MEEWKIYKLGDLLQVKYGRDHKSLSDGPIPAFGSGGLMRMVEKSIYDKPSILIPRKGSLNNILFVDRPFWTVDTMFWTIINTDIVIPHYLHYAIKDIDFASLNVGSAVPSLTVPIIEAIEVSIPDIYTQRRILDCLEPIDNKIALNTRINHNLEEQAQSLYKSWFIDFEPFKDGKFVESELGMIPEGWFVKKAEEFCEINIGKTPPRKEHQWFSNDSSDITWISISDMGPSGVYISKSSEMLTKEACRKFNVIVVPEGTVLLSFKLTIGRVSIAAKELTTNEAIARFLAPTDAISSYLYLALKSYDYGKLGSTSSIATAVNSKIIKGMPLLCPPEYVIEKFGAQVKGMFNLIRTLQNETMSLNEQRDSLLPRLMSGKISC